MRICFFANMTNHANWREMFETVEFYKVDIEILRSLGHEVVLAGDFKSLDKTADLYYCWWWTYAFYPILRSMPNRRPVIVTGAFDYDTCHGVIPGLCYLDRPLWQKWLMKLALKRATRNLFISQCEYDLVTEHLPVRNPVLSPLAINTAYYNPGTDVSQRGDYFFTVSWSSSTNAKRKCLDSIVEAFGRVAQARPNLRLVMAGKKGDHYDALVALARNAGMEDRVDFVGMISDEEKRDHYRRCLAYVQPTLFEGFGHAIGEAIACGAQVITSPSGAVPEVAGTYARFVTPNDVGQLAQAMLDVADTPSDPVLQAAQLRHIEANFSIEQRRKQLADMLDAVTSSR
ncbi:D-inositol-3-phosphate glycosyltransferase [Ralstonia flaminis]|jgi:glycosyltransferase involved in cell wall biosynthesis|uniref:D-inositol-3-phosphate glycosyltransferase n=2 Tax=Ralstonia flaminis TaxID=3058597 RepID=A0ABN9JE67_9RALS|nr:D-inositol-3-phosphate glycosyltransferase [Ralstonia sp. LMG 18101]